jgi:hypothetical protein
MISTDVCIAKTGTRGIKIAHASAAHRLAQQGLWLPLSWSYPENCIAQDLCHIEGRSGVPQVKWLARPLLFASLPFLEFSLLFATEFCYKNAYPRDVVAYPCDMHKGPL